jgi:hypothetical protein
MSVAESRPDCAPHCLAAAERHVAAALPVGAGVELGALDVALVTAAAGALTPAADVAEAGVADRDDPPHAARPMQAATAAIAAAQRPARCVSCCTLGSLERDWGCWEAGRGPAAEASQSRVSVVATDTPMARHIGP